MNKNDILTSIKSKLVIPAIVAPMFLVSSPKVVIEACKSGLIGSFPGPNARTINERGVSQPVVDFFPLSGLSPFRASEKLKNK